MHEVGKAIATLGVCGLIAFLASLQKELGLVAMMLGTLILTIIWR